jgi:hypothetical protein
LRHFRPVERCSNCQTQAKLHRYQVKKKNYVSRNIPSDFQRSNKKVPFLNLTSPDSSVDAVTEVDAAADCLLAFVVVVAAAATVVAVASVVVAATVAAAVASAAAVAVVAVAAIVAVEAVAAVAIVDVELGKCKTVSYFHNNSKFICH